MLRVKIIQPHPKYIIGSSQFLTKNEAFGLIDSGVAILSKDMTEFDYKTKAKKPKRK